MVITRNERTYALVEATIPERGRLGAYRIANVLKHSISPGLSCERRRSGGDIAKASD